jgi:hypothetical protein
MRAAALWLAIFAITVLETWIATWEARADRQVRPQGKSNKFSLRSANWAAAFELVLFVDILLLVKEGWMVLPPILAGAWWGKYHALERRRRKKARPRRKSPDTVVSDELNNEADA